MKQLYKNENYSAFEEIRDIDSSTATYADTSAIYIEMLCEKFKNRGVSGKVHSDAKRQEQKAADIRRLSPGVYDIKYGGVSAYDKKYRTGMYNGQNYMSSEDFALYYRDLRKYKMPHYYSRPSSEYDKAEAEAQRQAQEASGTLPKKALWLAMIREQTEKIKGINAEELKSFSYEWFPVDDKEKRREVKGKKFPKKIIPAFAIVTVSLFMIVASSVMVSREHRQVARLENEITSLEQMKSELNTKLEIKDNMIMIKEIAVGRYGMVSREYVNSKYIDLEGEEYIDVYEKTKDESMLSSILKAIGLKAE